MFSPNNQTKTRIFTTTFPSRPQRTRYSLVPQSTFTMVLSVASILLLGSSLIVSSTAQLADQALVGTWTTKSKSVFTGPGFYNPVIDKITEPNHPGISYSFTADGFYEEAYYRAISNRESLTSHFPLAQTTFDPVLLTLCSYSYTTRVSVCDPPMATWQIHHRNQWFAYFETFRSRRQTGDVSPLLLRPIRIHKISPARIDGGMLSKTKGEILLQGSLTDRIFFLSDRDMKSEPTPSTT